MPSRFAVGLVGVLLLFVAVDLALTQSGRPRPSPILAAEGSASITRLRSSDERTTVAVVPTDFADLAAPAHADSIPTDAALDAMVREAMLLGGIRDVLSADAEHVLLKPCIVVANRDPDRNTTPGVVRAVALVVHEIAPNARITIGEGPGAWLSRAHPDVHHWEVNVADGFDTGGYRAAIDDPRLADVDIEFVDLNFAEARLVSVPDGGWARDEYWVAAPVLDADVTITLPRLKLHFPDLGGITVSMKNQMGVAPGLKYGWPKKTGFPSGSGNPGIPHSVDILGEMITDLNLCADIDFAVAESVRNEGTQMWTDDSGYVRKEWVGVVIAGADQVAVDAVSAELMGKNHREVETVVNGHRRALGIGELEQIDLVGHTDLEPLRYGFRSWRSGHSMGMANRQWIVAGPFATAEGGMEAIDPAGTYHPGQDGFGEAVWFQDDKCDLGQLLNRPTDAVAYAYAEFDAPSGGPAKLQLASDEGLTVWLNGEQVYRFDGWRRIERPNDMTDVVLQPGRNRVLCRVEQTARQFKFSLNVVEADASPLTAQHQRPRDLRFRIPGQADAVREIFADDVRGQDHSVRQGRWREAHVDQTRPDSVSLAGIMPSTLQSDSLGVTHSTVVGRTLRVRRLRQDDQLWVIASSGVGALWVDPGLRPTELIAVHLDHEWNSEEERLEEIPRDTTMVWEGGAEPGQIVVLNRASDDAPWTATLTTDRPVPMSGDEVIATSQQPLEQGVYTIGLHQSAVGMLVADAFREAAEADVALTAAWELTHGLQAGPVTRGDLIDILWDPDSHVGSWDMTGAQVDSLMEGLIDRSLGDARVTPQISGFTVEVDAAAEKWHRVTTNLEPDRVYRFASWNWADRWLERHMRDISRDEAKGEWPNEVLHDTTVVTALEQHLRARDPYEAVQEKRLVAFNEAAN